MFNLLVNAFKGVGFFSASFQVVKNIKNLCVSMFNLALGREENQLGKFDQYDKAAPYYKELALKNEKDYSDDEKEQLQFLPLTIEQQRTEDKYDALSSAAQAGLCVLNAYAIVSGSAENPLDTAISSAVILKTGYDMCVRKNAPKR